MKTKILFLTLYFCLPSLIWAAEQPFASAVFRDPNTIELNLLSRLTARADDQYFLAVNGTESMPLKVSKSESNRLIFRLQQKYPIRELVQKDLRFVIQDSGGKVRMSTYLQLAPLLDHEFYYEGQLGLVWQNGNPTFNLWAPTAQEVKIHFYDENSGAEIAVENMQWNGKVWNFSGRSQLKNRFYLYEVKVFTPYQGKVVNYMVTDPYSISLSQGSAKSQVVDLNDATLKPVGWDLVNKPKLKDFSEVVIYESHIRDLTATDASIPENERGSYVALSSPRSAAYQHLQGLAKAGLTHLHLLPMSDFGSVLENRSQWKSLSFSVPPAPNSSAPQEQLEQIRTQDAYNWGYDPVHFLVPDGSYSILPNGSSRIFEFRQMIKAMNEIGLRVVMDMVYNHTFASGEDQFSVFDKIVPLYFYRLNPAGQIYKSSCCPDVATENAMVEKIITDSILHFAKEYKVDGFRFDLMNLHSLAGMTRLRNTVRSMTTQSHGVDGQKIYLYGEAWPFGSLEEKKPGESFLQLRSAKLGIGSFNDRFRDAIRGGTTSSNEKSDQGFATGLYYDFNHEPANQNTPTNLEAQRLKLLHLADVVKVGLLGNLKDVVFRDHLNNQIKGGDLNYRGTPVGYAGEPWESINYVSAHDGSSLWDAVLAKFPFSAQGPEALRKKIRAHRLILGLVMLSQGTPFFEGGSELLRSRSADVDSYDSGDWFNALDWSFQSNNWGKGLPPSWRNSSDWNFWYPRLGREDYKVSRNEILATRDYFVALLKVRKSSPFFHLGRAQNVQDMVRFPNDDRVQGDIPGFLIMQIQNQRLVVDPELNSVLVFFNASTTDQTFFQQSFKGRSFMLHPDLNSKIDSEIGRAHFESTQGVFFIPAQTIVVYQEKNR